MTDSKGSREERVAAPQGRLQFSLAILRWGLLFGLCALLTTRVVLVIHEFLGHAGAAWLLGGELTGHRLFIFGGGWVNTEVPGPRSLADRLFVSLGGVGLEVMVAGFAAFRARGVVGLAAVVYGIAAGLCAVHIGVYIGLGTHYGYGDGRVLHHALGGARVVITIAFCLVALVAAAFTTRALRRWVALDVGLARSGWVVLAAAALAAVLHGGLMQIEKSIADDPTYAEIMQLESERRARALVARERARRAVQGVPMGTSEIAARTRVLERAGRPLPIRIPFFVAMTVVIVLAAFRRDNRPLGRSPVQWRDLRGLAIALVVALVVVAVLWRPWWH